MNSELKHKNNVVFWHDFLKISKSRHKINRFRSLAVPYLLAILKQLENRLRALVYCQRDRTPNLDEELEKQSITVLHVGKKYFVSSRKQKDLEFMNEFQALH